MELTSIMQKLSFSQNPRDGQRQVIEAALNSGKNSLNVQLPTGYGKTFTACATYSVLREIGRVNRLLYITTSRAQNEQFKLSALSNFKKCGLTGPMRISDAGRIGPQAIKEHRNNTCQLFCLTIQMLSNTGWSTVVDMMETGQWMVVIDEYHHYGIDATWGRRILDLNCAFRLSMSATPKRRNGDSAFGEPDMSVDYERAVKENAVKPLHGHSYVYRIDAINKDGDVVSYTTSELTDDMGEGDKLEKIRIERKMRWSPRYISPLVSIPIERLIQNRLKTGLHLQAVIGAMCVSHAEMVCEQVKSMFQDLSVDWVGTGVNGRTDEENAEIISKFAPTDNKCPGSHTIDVLVHVGMAGEGLDSIFVSEVIHLNKAALNNSNNQENGRAARYLPGVVGNINFDSCSDYATKGFVGSAIMQAFSEEIAKPCEECGNLPCICETKEREESEKEFELPEEPTIYLADMELVNINSGDIKMMQKMIIEAPHIFHFGITNENKDEPEHIEFVKDYYRKIMRREAEDFNKESEIRQLQEAVNLAAGQLSYFVIRQTYNDHQSIPNNIIGEIKKKINSRKKRDCGEIKLDNDVLRKHYAWLKNLEVSIKQTGIPAWLA